MKQTSIFDEPVSFHPAVAIFAIERRRLLEGLRNIKSAVTISRKDRFQLQFELFVLENKVIFRLYENEFHVDAKVKGSPCRTLLYYADVYDTLKNSKEFWVDVTLREKTIGLNQVNLTSPTELLDPTLKEIPLQLLATPSDPLTNFSPTPDKQIFTHDLSKGFYPETLEKDIRLVYTALKKYNISKKEISSFIHHALKFQKQ